MGEGTEGTEEAKAVETVPPELPHSSEEEEEQKEDGKRKKKGKKVYTPADFKFAQPLLKRQSVVPVFRSRKWFRHYHELVKLDRNDPRPQQRAEIRAAKQAAVERGRLLKSSQERNQYQQANKAVTPEWTVPSTICTIWRSIVELVDVISTRIMDTKKQEV